MLSVLRHPQFRVLWAAQVVSQAGDWMTRLAVLTLIGQLAGVQAALIGLGLSYAIETATMVLPPGILGPLAGPVADRLPRRAIMITADIVRAAVVLALLLVRDPAHVPLLYVVTVAKSGTAMFFESARSAALPSTVPRDELHAAYALSAATWSTMLVVGAVLGGLLVELLGVRGVFVLDSVTYLFSALLLTRLRLPPVAKHPQRLKLADVVLFRDLRRGLDHARERHLGPVLLAKPAWGVAGGLFVMLYVSGKVQWPVDGSPSQAIMVLLSARGLGTALGPILARRFFGSSESALRLQTALGFVFGIIGYLLFSGTSQLWVAFFCIVFAHIGGSSIWIATNVWWQRHVDDAFRGRVFALEFLGVMSVTALSGIAGGMFFDWSGSVATTVQLFCILVAISGGAWWSIARRMRPAPPRDSIEDTGAGSPASPDGPGTLVAPTTSTTVRP